MEEGLFLISSEQIASHRFTCFIYVPLRLASHTDKSRHVYSDFIFFITDTLIPCALGTLAMSIKSFLHLQSHLTPTVIQVSGTALETSAYQRCSLAHPM